MKRFTVLIVAALCLTAAASFGQQSTDSSTGQHAPTVAPAYKALYVLNEDDDKVIRGLLRNVGNALNDPRLSGKLHIEVVAFGAGVALYKKNNHYDSLMAPLLAKGVTFVQCTNTLRERGIDKAELFDFVGYVPSGNGEIILRHYQGWAVVHP